MAKWQVELHFCGPLLAYLQSIVFFWISRQLCPLNFSEAYAGTDLYSNRAMEFLQTALVRKKINSDTVKVFFLIESIGVFTESMIFCLKVQNLAQKLFR